ncbi:MAG: transposase [Candidatus Sedimenticola sp. (ex Thyasira tokunagai)]
MARLQRLNPPGIAQHIIQRGNNRQICFSSEEDFSIYLKWLMEYAEKFGMDIHAYVLMTNHVHILATPRCAESISKTMQSLGRQYVRYFNHTYRRTGTLWEGRYKSCLVQSEQYLLAQKWGQSKLFIS